MYPMTEVLLGSHNILCAEYAQEIVYGGRFFADERIYESPYLLVKELIRMKCDVWFVTGLNRNY